MLHIFTSKKKLWLRNVNLLLKFPHLVCGKAGFQYPGYVNLILMVLLPYHAVSIEYIAG